MTDRTFGEYLRLQMVRANLRPADIERETGLDASLVSKWVRDKALPSTGNLRRLAPALGVSHADLLARAGHVDADDAGSSDSPPSSEMDPLIAELSALLDPNGPMPDDARETLATLIEHAVRPYRRYLRKRRTG